MLSIDSILGLVTSIEKLTDTATEGSPGSPGKPNGAPAWMPVDRAHCTALIEVCWRTILDTLSQLLSRTSGEALVVQLLKAGFVSFHTGRDACSYRAGSCSSIQCRPANGWSLLYINLHLSGSH